MNCTQLLPYIAIFSASCAFTPDESMRPETPAAEVPASVNSGSADGNEPNPMVNAAPFLAKAEVEDMDGVGQYRVSLKISAKTAPPQLVRRLDAQGQIYDLGYVDGDGELRDTHVVSGDTYIYKIGETSLSVHVPRDEELRGVQELSTNLRIEGRLWLAEGTRLVAAKKGLLKIEAREIIANHAEILAFNGPADPNVDGRQPTDLLIKAQRARGALRIDWRGQVGGRGTPGGRPGKKPGQAPAGTPGSSSDSSEFLERGHGRVSCMADPGNGQAGERGYNGEDGHAGAQGGSGGRLLVLIHAAEALTLNADVSGGAGGEGGEGGRGGEGQAGGAPGNPSPRCRNAQAGPVGPDGFPGRPGARGANGSAGSACLLRGPTKEGACDQVLDLISLISGAG